MVTDASKRRSQITFEFFLSLFVVKQIFELAVFQTSSLPLLNWRRRLPRNHLYALEKIKFIRQFSGQLACTLTRISLFTLSMRVDKAGLQFYFFLFPFFNSRQFLRQCCRQSFDVYLKRTKKTVERTCSPWIFPGQNEQPRNRRSKIWRRDHSFEGTVHTHGNYSWETETKTAVFV